jgi:hypothetical protein
MHMAMLYDQAFMTIREPLKVLPAQMRLQNLHFWEGLIRFTEVAAQYAPRRWFIRYGDADIEAQLRLARQLQSVDEYNRARLSRPARSYFTERQLLQQHTGSSQAEGAFLELVMGFSCDVRQLRANGQRLQETFHQANDIGERTICITDQPDEIPCHTPLNQRLLRANFDLCQWFTTTLLQLKPGQVSQVDKRMIPGISIAGFQTVCDSLELQNQERMHILTFGRQYLAQYLEVGDAELRSDPGAPRRINALAQLEAKARDAASGSLPSPGPGRQWLYEQSQTGWFYFPESFWMQYHWFNSFIGLDLITELALIDAMVMAGGNQVER